MKQRDQRFDLLRGIALLVIFVDHIEMVTGQFLFSAFTLHQWGLSDGLDAFVFLSGCVFGIVHLRVQQHGFMPSQLKSLRRGLTLAVANWIAFLGVLAVAFLLHPSAMLLSRMELAPAIDETATKTIQAAVLGYQPFGFDVLPLYILVLCLAPGLLWLSRRTLTSAIILSLALYAAALIFPSLWPRTSDGVNWEYHPLGWQLVFFAGMLATTVTPNRRLRGFAPKIAAVCLALFLPLTALAGNIIHIASRYDVSWLVGRHIPGPIRMLHFGLLVGFVSYLVTVYRSRLLGGPLDWLQLVGRHPLPVFLFGLWFTYLSYFLLAGESWFFILLAEIVGISLSVIVAMIRDHPRRSR